MGISIFHSVYLDTNLCVGCTTCIKHCPTQAIRVREGKASIMEERCIDCGECIRVCPKGAKKSATDPLALMSDYDIRVALPAPSLYGQFGSACKPAEIFDALYSVGFNEVFDVAWGASVLTPAIRRFVASTQTRPLISSACPVIVRLIQLRFPSLIPNLVPFLPPMEITARKVRELLAQIYQSDRRYSMPGESGEFDQHRAGVFFITPCTSKVTAIRLPLGYKQSMVSAVFSFQDIFASLKKAMAPRGEGEAGDPAPHGHSGHEKFSRFSGLGRGFDWARSDGELESLRIPGAVSVDGIENVITLFEDIDNGKFSDIPYIEALACPGGCVGGPMAVANPHVARSTIKAIAASANSSASQTQAESAKRGSVSPERNNDSPERLYSVTDESMRWETEVTPTPVMLLDRDLTVALKLAEGMETIAASLPGLDCGACGGPDCRSLAEDIVKGKAKIDDCIVRLKQKIIAPEASMPSSAACGKQA
ncbi:MAG: 4Fe-4S binding protein [Spirochaetaceae bacterium]|nr:4Fe-4S binding protein [Spirochaetaceae bacterium]